MSRIFFHILLIFASFSGAYADSVECSVALNALKEASEIRLLAVKKSVPCLVQDRKEVEKYLLSIIDEQLPPEKLSNEEYIYKKLGLIPESYNYKKGIVELYLSQLGGYYDPEKDHFVMAGWLPAKLQTGIAAHELTHALQDQYYDLKKFIDPLIQNGDTVLAHSALVEGDATAVMYDYERKLSGKKPLAKEDNIGALLLANLTGSLPNSSSIPKSLQLILIFPYTGGFGFVHHILKAEGYEGLDHVYKHPPHTTEEIIHIEKYRNRKQDYIEFTEKDLAEGVPSEYKLVYQDTLGEFGLAALLNMQPLNQTQIKDAAAGWGGDRIALFVNDKNKRKIIVWEQNWDSEKDLEEFKAVYLNSKFISKQKEKRIRYEGIFQD